MKEINYTHLGAKEREQTLSDFHLGALTPLDAIPESFLPTYSVPIEHQRKLPACGAHAGAEVIEILTQTPPVSPQYLWKRIKQIDGYLPTDGTDMPSIFKILQKKGVCEESLLSNDTTLPLDVYTDPSSITTAMDANATLHTVNAYAFQFNPSFDDIKRAIYHHKAVVLLLRVGAEWWTDKNGNNSWQEKDILPLRTNVAITSGHFVTAYGYDKNYVYFYNHWSNQWGRNGIGYFGADYVSRVIEIGTTVVSYTFSKVLKLGMSGTDVGMLQKKLKDLGYFNYSVTSYFGSITLASVKKFQADHHLTADGIVGAMTNAALNK